MDMFRKQFEKDYVDKKDMRVPEKNNLVPSEITKIQKKPLNNEVNSENQIDQEFRTAYEKKDDMDNNTEKDVGKISPPQSQSKKPAQFCALAVGAMALVLAFGLGRMTALSSTAMQ